MDNEAESWERRRGETGPAYRAFEGYRELGPGRSVHRAAQVVGKSTRLLERWSARWGWVERAAAWDDAQSRAAHEAALEEVRREEKQLFEDARRLRTIALQTFVQRDPASGETKVNPRLTPATALRLYQTYVDLVKTVLTQLPSLVSPAAEQGDDRMSEAAQLALAQELAEGLLGLPAGWQARLRSSKGRGRKKGGTHDGNTPKE
jgi:hypothetical protein